MKYPQLLSILVCALAACAGGEPGGTVHTMPGTGGGSGGGGGGGSGSGSGSGSGGGGGGGSSLTATDFLAQMDQKFCAEAFTCMSTFPTDAGVTFADAFGSSQQACESQAAAYEMPQAVESEITAGKIHYDGAAAAQCVAGITFGACSDFWTNGPMAPAACSSVFMGTVADGGACVVDYDCSAATSICDPTAHTCGPDTSGQTGSATTPADLRIPFNLKTAAH